MEGIGRRKPSEIHFDTPMHSIEMQPLACRPSCSACCIAPRNPRHHWPRHRLPTASVENNLKGHRLAGYRSSAEKDIPYAVPELEATLLELG